jgi:hypothetical protein
VDGRVFKLHTWVPKRTIPRLGALQTFGGTPTAQGESCETNPICTGVMGRASPLWAEIYGELDRHRSSAKQSQFAPGAQERARAAGAAEGPRGPIVQNKPNLPPAGREDHRQGRRPWRCHPSLGQWHETKPIPLRGEPPRERNVRNKPNFASRDGGGGEGHGAIAQNEPNFGLGGRREPPLFQYSIIPPFQPDADCAKQSQFTRVHRTRRGQAGRVSEGVPGTCYTNKANSCSSAGKPGGRRPHFAGQEGPCRVTWFRPINTKGPMNEQDTPHMVVSSALHLFLGTIAGSEAPARQNILGKEVVP